MLHATRPLFLQKYNHCHQNKSKSVHKNYTVANL